MRIFASIGPPICCKGHEVMGLNLGESHRALTDFALNALPQDIARSDANRPWWCLCYRDQVRLRCRTPRDIQEEREHRFHRASDEDR